MQLLLDGADANTATTILGYAGALVAEANAAAAPDALARAGPRAPPAIDYEPRVWYNPELRSTQFLVPGLIGFLLMLTAVLSTALSVVREKERGTMEQLRVTPAAHGELILGKTLPYLGDLARWPPAIILVAARVLFGVEVRGSYLDLFAATLLYLIGALGFGLLVSTLADTQAHRLPGRPARLAAAGDLPLGLHLPDPLHAGRACRRSPTLVPARYFLVVLRGIILKGAGLEPYCEQMALPRALRRGRRWASPRCAWPARRPERARPLARDRQGVPAAPAGQAR